MKISIDELYRIIGRKETEIAILRNVISDFEAKRLEPSIKSAIDQLDDDAPLEEPKEDAE